MPDLKKNSLIIAFGDLTKENGQVVTARQIADGLLGSNRWLTTRLPKDGPEPGTAVLFYQKSVGIIASAKVDAVSNATGHDIISALGYREPMLRYLWHLSVVDLISPPILLRPLVYSLSFVANKEFWGHSLRLTPRWISDSDFAKIIQARSSQDAKHAAQ